MDFKKLIQVADVFGTETRKLVELREGELADRMRSELDWSEEDSQEIEDAVIATGNDPAELAGIMTDAPAQPQAPETGDAPTRPSQDGPAVGIDADLPPEQPQAPAQDAAPQTDTTPPTAPRGDSAADVAQDDAARTPPARPTAPRGDSAADVAQDDAARTPPARPTAPRGDSAADVAQDDAARAAAAPQTDAELDADSADNATPAQGDALAGRLDTQTPSLLDAYNEGGRRALDNVRDLQTALSRLGFDPNGIDGKYGRGTYAAVQEFQRQNGLQVDGEAGPATMAKLQELLNGGAGEEQPQGDSAADVAQDDAARTAPQTDAENDADSADNATPAQPAQTNAELDADSADTATPQQIDPEALAAVRRVGNPSRVGTDAGDGMVWIIGNGNFFTRTRPNNPKVAAQQAAAASLRSQQNNSKEFDMKKFIKESRELEECGPEMSMPQNEGNPVTMSVTLNASGEQNVQDLIRMMQLAGAKDAAPVAAMHVGPQIDKHDDMVNMMRMMDAPEESVEEEWDNAPEEEYRDHKHMTKDLSGGLNREKKAYKAAQPGDNAMAVESSIKEQLLKALEGKYANDAQRKAIHANKKKK
jgi:peptidoglycan hydrolase-like protein with peptidoglycan-binding domain